LLVMIWPGFRGSGGGNSDEAVNFVAAEPTTPPHDIIHWMGEDLCEIAGPVAA
jgi:hypothetical protein